MALAKAYNDAAIKALKFQNIIESGAHYNSPHRAYKHDAGVFNRSVASAASARNAYRNAIYPTNVANGMALFGESYHSMTPAFYRGPVTAIRKLDSVQRKNAQLMERALLSQVELQQLQQKELLKAERLAKQNARSMATSANTYYSPEQTVSKELLRAERLARQSAMAIPISNPNTRKKLRSSINTSSVLNNPWIKYYAKRIVPMKKPTITDEDISSVNASVLANIHSTHAERYPKYEYLGPGRFKKLDVGNYKSGKTFYYEYTDPSDPMKTHYVSYEYPKGEKAGPVVTKHSMARYAGVRYIPIPEGMTANDVPNVRLVDNTNPVYTPVNAPYSDNAFKQDLLKYHKSKYAVKSVDKNGKVHVGAGYDTSEKMYERVWTPASDPAYKYRAKYDFDENGRIRVLSLGRAPLKVPEYYYTDEQIAGRALRNEIPLSQRTQLAPAVGPKVLTDAFNGFAEFARQVKNGYVKGRSLVPVSANKGTPMSVYEQGQHNPFMMPGYMLGRTKMLTKPTTVYNADGSVLTTYPAGTIVADNGQFDANKPNVAQWRGGRAQLNKAPNGQYTIQSLNPTNLIGPDGKPLTQGLFSSAYNSQIVTPHTAFGQSIQQQMKAQYDKYYAEVKRAARAYGVSVNDVNNSMLRYSEMDFTNSIVDQSYKKAYSGQVIKPRILNGLKGFDELSRDSYLRAIDQNIVAINSKVSRYFQSAFVLHLAQNYIAPFEQFLYNLFDKTIQTFKEFDKVYADYIAKADTGGILSMNAMVKASSSNVFSATDVATVAERYAASGIDASKNLEQLTYVLKTATIAQTDYNTVANAAIKTQMAFGLAVEDTAMITDAWVAGANASTAELDDMIQAFQYMASTAKNAGLSVQDTAGYIAMLNSQGLANIQTSFRQLLFQFRRSDVKERFAGMFGFTDEDYTNMNVVLQRVRKYVQEATDATDKQARLTKLQGLLGGKSQAFDALQAFANISEAQYQMIDAAVRQSGYTADLYEKTTNNLAHKLEMLSTELQSLYIHIGETIKPVAIPVIDSITSLISGLNSIPTDRLSILTGLGISAGTLTGVASSAVGLGGSYITYKAMLASIIPDLMNYGLYFNDYAKTSSSWKYFTQGGKLSQSEAEEDLDRYIRAYDSNLVKFNKTAEGTNIVLGSQKSIFKEHTIQLKTLKNAAIATAGAFALLGGSMLIDSAVYSQAEKGHYKYAKMLNMLSAAAREAAIAIMAVQVAAIPGVGPIAAAGLLGIGTLANIGMTAKTNSDINEMMYAAKTNSLMSAKNLSSTVVATPITTETDIYNYNVDSAEITTSDTSWKKIGGFMSISPTGM